MNKTQPLQPALLRTDFADAERWAEMASARKLRLPLWRQPCTRGQMGKWLKKLDISLSQYQDWTGEKTLGEFPKRNPDWPLRAWVGLLLEWTQIEPMRDYPLPGAGAGSAVKHGHSRTQNRSKTYTSWLALKARCLDPKNNRYSDYGGRGITVCERWLSFENFLADMGERPEGKSIDRVDNDGNYEPSNCRWATPVEQRANRRKKPPNRLSGRAEQGALI